MLLSVLLGLFVLSLECAARAHSDMRRSRTLPHSRLVRRATVFSAILCKADDSTAYAMATADDVAAMRSYLRSATGLGQYGDTTLITKSCGLVTCGAAQLLAVNLKPDSISWSLNDLSNYMLDPMETACTADTSGAKNVAAGVWTGPDVSGSDPNALNSVADLRMYVA